MIGDVYDSAVEKKSPLILNHMAFSEAIASGGCASPLAMSCYAYEDPGVLQTIITHDSYLNDSDEEEAEPRDPPPPSSGSDLEGDAGDDDEASRDPPPPSFGSDPTPPKHIEDGNIDDYRVPMRSWRPRSPLPNIIVEEPSDTENIVSSPKNLLAKAREETASPCASNMLEASKHLNFENQSISSPKSGKTKEHQYKVTLPLYASEPVGRKIELDLPLEMAASPRKEQNEDQAKQQSSEDAIKEAAEAKWIAAKERCSIPDCFSGEEVVDNELALPELWNNPSGAYHEEEGEHALADDVTVEYDGLAAAFAASSNAKSEGHDDDDGPSSEPQGRKTMDPPGYESAAPEDDDGDEAILYVVESLKRSVVSTKSTLSSQHSTPIDERQTEGEEGSHSYHSAHFPELSTTLKELEDQQAANRSMLFEQRLRHQQRKTQRKEQQKASLSFSPSLPSSSSNAMSDTDLISRLTSEADDGASTSIIA
jgi:hypothetical protein